MSHDLVLQKRFIVKRVHSIQAEPPMNGCTKSGLFQIDIQLSNVFIQKVTIIILDVSTRTFVDYKSSVPFQISSCCSPKLPPDSNPHNSKPFTILEFSVQYILLYLSKTVLKRMTLGFHWISLTGNAPTWSPFHRRCKWITAVPLSE